MSRTARINFQVIAKYPSAMLVAGGILMILLDKTFWAVLLIGLGAFLHIMWLKRQ